MAPRRPSWFGQHLPAIAAGAQPQDCIEELREISGRLTRDAFSIVSYQAAVVAVFGGAAATGRITQLWTIDWAVPSLAFSIALVSLALLSNRVRVLWIAGARAEDVVISELRDVRWKALLIRWAILFLLASLPAVALAAANSIPK